MSNEIKGSKTDWWIDRMLRGLINTALAMPYHWRVPMFGALVRRAIGPVAGYTRRSRKNLEMIWPNLSRADRNLIASQVSAHVGRVVIENYAPNELRQRAGKFSVGGAGWEVLQKAKAEGRPILAVSAHFGNYEAARSALTHHGLTFGGVYRPMRNPYFNAHYVKQVEAVAGPVFASGARGMAGFVRALAKGTPMMLLNDLHIGHGVALPFLGHPAMTATSAAELALRYNALLVPIYGIRLSPTSLDYRVEIEEPIAHTDPETMTLALNRSLENLINNDPAQWFWVHRRWKI